MRTLIAMSVIGVTLTALLAGPLQATTDDANGRYSFKQVKDDLLRLDSQTGQVSLCSKREAGWSCQTLPDERAVLESEIARLQNQNTILKKDLIARGLPLPSGIGHDWNSAKPIEPDLKLPSPADVDRMMSFMEKLWRRLIDMVQNMQKDLNTQKDMDNKGLQKQNFETNRKG